MTLREKCREALTFPKVEAILDSAYKIEIKADTILAAIGPTLDEADAEISAAKEWTAPPEKYGEALAEMAAARDQAIREHQAAGMAFSSAIDKANSDAERAERNLNRAIAESALLREALVDAVGVARGAGEVAADQVKLGDQPWSNSPAFITLQSELWRRVGSSIAEKMATKLNSAPLAEAAARVIAAAAAETAAEDAEAQARLEVVPNNPERLRELSQALDAARDARRAAVKEFREMGGMA